MRRSTKVLGAACLALGLLLTYAVFARQGDAKGRKAGEAGGVKGAAGQKKASPYAKDEEAIFKNAEAFAKAFRKEDAKAVAAFWKADGDYIDRNGKHFKGRAAIEKAFKELFAENKGLRLHITVNSVSFVSPELAVEDGTTDVIPADGATPSRARYTIVHAKKDGQWLLASVRDAIFVPPTNYEHLRGLEWAVGDWVDDGDKADVGRVSFSWATNQNFLLSTSSTVVRGVSVGGTTQWIGWDPVAKGIRSWSFDTDGAFGSATWTRDGDKWSIKTQTVLRDGKKLATTNIVTRVDADNMTWESKDRTLDGKALPDVAAIKMKRVK
jgi:uncharacterized protein (TIGR02246 family)